MRRISIQKMETLDYSGTEALNSICTNLSFVGRDMKKFVFTSCTENEGKSSMTVQIMANLARRGKRVCLVDGDFRKSMMVKRFGLVSTDGGELVGAAHYLAGYNPLDDVIYESDIPGAYIVPVGREMANPLPLLDSVYFTTMLDELAGLFDLVLVDAPPVGLVIDSAVIAKSCDGAVMVIEYGKRRKGEVIDSVRQIEQSGCKVVGCIINKVSIRTISERNYYKNHYYSYSHYSHYEYTKDAK